MDFDGRQEQGAYCYPDSKGKANPILGQCRSGIKR